MNFYLSITSALKRERETIVQIDDDEKKQYHVVNFDTRKFNLLHINANMHAPLDCLCCVTVSSTNSRRVLDIEWSGVKVKSEIRE